MAKITMQNLLTAGVHFGHQKRYWNPRMSKYIYGIRNKIHIIDLQQTLPMLNDALNFVSATAAQDGTVLFVGTKKVASEIIKEQAERCGMPYVSHRWLGGMLTNFKTIKQSINRLKELEVMSQDGSFNKLTKKEALMRTRELEKLNLGLGGIKDMQGMPDVIFVVDVRYEKIALKEAKSLAKQIPIVAVVDSNCNPELVDYIVPGNDDAFRAVRLYATAMADAVIDGKLSNSITSMPELEETESQPALEEVAEIAEPAEDVNLTETADVPEAEVVAESSDLENASEDEVPQS